MTGSFIPPDEPDFNGILDRDLWQEVAEEEGIEPTDEEWNKYRDFVLVLLGVKKSG